HRDALPHRHGEHSGRRLDRRRARLVRSAGGSRRAPPPLREAGPPAGPQDGTPHRHRRGARGGPRARARGPRASVVRPALSPDPLNAPPPSRLTYDPSGFMLTPMSLFVLAQPPVPHPAWTLGPWATEHLPTALLRTGPWGVAVWQWTALLLLVVLAIAFGVALGTLTHAILQRVTRRMWPDTQLDDLLVAQARGPLRIAWTLALFGLGAPFIGFGAVAQ